MSRKLQNQKARISKRTVDSVAVPEAGEARLWDTDLHGFFVRVYASGRRVYALKYRVGPIQRIYTIGAHGSPWTPDQAREAAKALLRRAAEGDDPAIKKAAERTAPRVSDLVEKYVTEGPATKPDKRTTTWENDSSNLRRHIVPLIGRKIADAVTKGDAAKAIQDIVDGKTAVDEKSLNKRGRAIVTGGAGVGRRTRTTAAAMYAWGIEHGHVRTNPFAGVKLAKPPVKERFLSPSEAARLLDVITARESEGNMHPAMADAVRLLILTGARKTEVCSLKWSEVDFERRVITLPPERTKAGGQNGIRHIRLSDPALLILHRRHESKGLESEFVFQSTRGQGPIVGLRKPYIAAREAAGLGGVRIHDLRHSFASFLIADGASLYLVSKMLGHASARTTERYAHLSDNPLQDAAASVAQIISQKSVIAKEK